MKEIEVFVCTMIPIFVLVQFSAKKFERKEKISKIFLRSLILNAVVLCLFGWPTHELLNTFLITEYDLYWTLWLDYGLSDFCGLTICLSWQAL